MSTSQRASELEALVVAARHGMEQVYNAIFDAAYSLIELEKRVGREVAYAAAGPIDAAYEVVNSKEQLALYEALYRAMEPHPFPEIWEKRRVEIAEILSNYTVKEATA